MKIKWIAMCLSMLMMLSACSFFGGNDTEQEQDTQINQEEMDNQQDSDQGDEAYGPDDATQEEETQPNQEEEKQPSTSTNNDSTTSTGSSTTTDNANNSNSGSSQQTEQKKLSSSEALKVVKQNIDTSQYSAQVINNSLKVDGNEYVLILVSDSQATLEPAVAVNVYTGELKSYYPDGTIHDYQGFSDDDDSTPKG